MTKRALRVLIVDDEAPARARLRDLLGDLALEEPTEIVGVAANGAEALRFLDSAQPDVVLVDVRMPAMSGVEFARALADLEDAPCVVLVTAFENHAVEAFEVAVTDYLVKPVRAARLGEALARVRRLRQPVEGGARGREHFNVTERGRVLRLPIAEVLFLRAEMKYVTAATQEREYVLDESLVQIEQEFPARFLRVHRSCLVALEAVAGVERGRDGGDSHWDIVLRGHEERLPVSRRQWAVVKQALSL